MNDDEEQKLRRSFALLVCYSVCRMMTTNEKRENVFREKKIFIDEPEKRTRQEKKKPSRFLYGDACWIRSSWDLITSILKHAHTHIRLLDYYMCVFTNDKPKSTDQCIRKASGQREKSGEQHICQSLNSLTNKKKKERISFI